MTQYAYELDPFVDERPRVGLIVLEADETIEGEIVPEFNRLNCDIHVGRVRSEADVTIETLSQMKADLPVAVGLLPGGRPYDVIGYGCTSGSSVIGSETVADLIKSVVQTKNVTDPLAATIAWCRQKNINELGILSPYVPEVSVSLQSSLQEANLSIGAFGSFGVSKEAKVVRISSHSIIDAAIHLCGSNSPDALLLSCTNLRTENAIPTIEAVAGIPVISSNSALCWHMKHLANLDEKNR